MTDLKAWLQEHERVWRLSVVLFLSSALSVMLFIYRTHLSGHVTYQFLVWNLFLAWIPLGFALLMWKVDHARQRSLPALAILFCCWLLFFPNAPYIITDLQHVDSRWPIPIWYDLALVFFFAWNGLILGFISLWIVQGIVAAQFGRVAGWALAILALLAGSFGIYLGRFLRFNSWDIITEPEHLLRNILTRIANPLEHPPTVSMTLVYALVLIMAYLTLTLLTGVNSVRERHPVQSLNSSNN